VNLLIDKLPDTIEIDGEDFPINSGFRPCIRIILAFEDEELTSAEKQVILLRNIYKVMPDNTEEAIHQGAIFLNGGEVSSEDEGVTPRLRLYSFQKDAKYIFAAFRQTHGIDLELTDMHWWKFLALFDDLGNETAFWSLISLRKKLKTNKASQEERDLAREMDSVIELPEFDMRPWEEREQEAIFLRQVEEHANG